MRVPIIASKDINSTSAINLHPTVGSNAQIVYVGDDGDNIVQFHAKEVTCMDQLPNKTYQKVYTMDDTGDSWQVAVTASRITFYNPMVPGMFGTKPKLKKGKASVGHLYFNQILMIRAGFMDAASPYVSIGCQRYDKTVSHIVIIAQKEKLVELLELLKQRIPEYVESIGKGMQVDGDFVQKWDAFFASDLFDGKERMTIVPSKKISLVYNSEVAPT